MEQSNNQPGVADRSIEEIRSLDDMITVTRQEHPEWTDEEVREWAQAFWDYSAKSPERNDVHYEAP